MSQTALGAKPAGSADASQVSSGPKQAGLVLATLIVVAAVANLPWAMADVALPSIGVPSGAASGIKNYPDKSPPVPPPP